MFDNNCPVFAFITNSHQSKSLSQLRENFFQYITSKVCLKVSGDHALVSVSTEMNNWKWTIENGKLKMGTRNRQLVTGQLKNGIPDRQVIFFYLI